MMRLIDRAEKYKGYSILYNYSGYPYFCDIYKEIDNKNIIHVKRVYEDEDSHVSLKNQSHDYINFLTQKLSKSKSKFIE